jgi:hypothetical protein
MPKNEKGSAGMQMVEPQLLTKTAYPRVEQSYAAAPKHPKQVDNHALDLTSLYSPLAKYTAEEKLASVLAYVMTGSVRGVVRLTGFKQQVISDWKNNSSWWPDAYAKVKKQKQEEIDGSLTSIIHASSGAIMDRILNGDEVIDKNGDVVRRALSGKDVAWIFGVTFDKRALLRGDPTSRTEKVDQTSMMEDLKQDFAKMAREHLNKTTVN